MNELGYRLRQFELRDAMPQGKTSVCVQCGASTEDDYYLDIEHRSYCPFYGRSELEAYKGEMRLLNGIGVSVSALIGA